MATDTTTLIVINHSAESCPKFSPITWLQVIQDQAFDMLLVDPWSNTDKLEDMK